MIRAIRAVNPSFTVAGMLDNDPTKHGSDFHGIPILGGNEMVSRLASSTARFVNLITGSTKARHQTTQEILAAGGVLGNFIHPNVDLYMVQLGKGIYVQESVVLQAAVKLGDNSSIHTSTVIAHETTVGNSVFIAHEVSVSGCCNIGDGTFIGTNATILPRVTIGKWATIGAGAVINKDIPDYATAVGNPARVIRIETPKGA